MTLSEYRHYTHLALRGAFERNAFVDHPAVS